MDALFARMKADHVGPAPVLSPAVRSPAVPSPTVRSVSAEPGSGPGTAVTDERALSGRDEVLEPIEAALTSHLKRALQEEQSEVLDRMRRERELTPEAVLPEPSSRARRLADIALPHLRAAIQSGSKSVAPSVEVRASAPPDPREAASRLAAAVAEPLGERLRRCMEGEGIEVADRSAVSEAVSGAYRQWRQQELEVLARHHVVAAFAAGAYASSPDRTQRWVVDDVIACPDCDDNALAEGVGKGEPFPTGQLHPPAHEGCRCLLLPAVP